MYRIIPPPSRFKDTNLHEKPKLDQITLFGISQEPSLSYSFILSVPFGIRNAIAELL